MKAHISDSDTIGKMEIQTKLLQIRQEGLATGTKAVSKVIYDKATDESKTYEERIADIIKFCKVGLAIKEKEEEKTA